VSRPRALAAVVALGAAAVLLVPAAAEACAVCVSGSERNRMAFFWTTVFLSLLPLAAIAGGLVWLARRAGAGLAAEFEDRDAWPPPAAGAPPRS